MSYDTELECELEYMSQQQVQHLHYIRKARVILSPLQEHSKLNWRTKQKIKKYLEATDDCV